MIKRLWDGICDLLHDGGPSMTRVINFIVAVNGFALLYYTAKTDGATGWPWAACFIAYLIYGAGQAAIKQAIDAVKYIKGGKDESTETQKTQ